MSSDEDNLAIENSSEHNENLDAPVNTERNNIGNVPSTSNADANVGAHVNNLTHGGRLLLLSSPSGKEYKLFDVLNAIKEFGKADKVWKDKKGVFVQFESDVSGFKDWQVKIGNETAKIELVTDGEKSGDNSRPSSSSSISSLEYDNNPECTALRDHHGGKQLHKGD